MSSREAACIVAACAAIAFTIIWQRRKNRRLLLRLQKMLDEAIQGDFQESCYDESLFSAVETKLAQYLSASCVSAKNLTEEKEKIKELIADISHQTKTPLSNILLYGQLLAEQPLPQESIPCVTALNDQAKKLDFLIGALVKVSRLETGVLALSTKEQPLLPLLEHVVQQAQSKASEKGVSLTVGSAEELTACYDWKWTAEALYNVVDNAIKYTPAGGMVHLTVTSYELFARIDVEDNGIGIPEEEQEKIFGRFYRGIGVREQEGVGIGLYLTRQILTEEKGYVKVSSHRGQGTLFSMFLPKEKNEKEIQNKNLSSL